MKEAIQTTEVELGKIIEDSRNIRKGQDPDFQNLVDNVKANGILQAIILRAHPKKKNMYELLAGHRRFKAAEKAGLKAIPAAIYDVNDQEALIITVTENLQRKNLSPLEEAQEIKRLMDLHSGDTRAVAADLGKSERWVARRAKLFDLTAEWIKALDTAKNGRGELIFRFWSSGHMEIIARHDSETQSLLLKEILKNKSYEANEWSISDLESWLSEKTHLLKKAPWKLDDDSLYPAAGACNTCPKRSCRQPLLFDDDLTEEQVKNNDKCLDPACWDKKQEAHVAIRISDLQQKHPNLLKISNEYISNLPEDVLEHNDYESVKKNAEGSVPAVITHGHGVGTLKWIKLHSWAKQSSAAKPRDTKGKVKPTSLAEKKKRFWHRRNAWIVVEIRKLLDEPTQNAPLQIFDSPDPDRAIAALAATFGTNGKEDTFSHVFRVTKRSKNLWEDYEERLGIEDDSSVVMDLWYEIAPVLSSRLLSRTGEDATERIPEVKRICELLGIKYEDFEKGSIEALPDPKSWAKEEKHKAGKTEKESPPKVSKKSKAQKKKAPKKKRQVKRGSLLNRTKG